MATKRPLRMFAGMEIQEAVMAEAKGLVAAAVGSLRSWRKGDSEETNITTG